VKTALDLIDDPLHHLRKVAVKFDLPMPTMEAVQDDDGTVRYSDEQWPESGWALHWFFPNEAPSIETGDGRLNRHAYESATDALRAVLPVVGRRFDNAALLRGPHSIPNLVAEFLTTRLIHDPLQHATYKKWAATGKPRRGQEWKSAMAEHSWADILAAKDNWTPWFTELIALLCDTAGLVEGGHSVHSSHLTERATAWALLIRVDDLSHAGEPYDTEYTTLLDMGRNDTIPPQVL
jgi:hypothetical protein